MELFFGTFHDAVTGETITRELTADEIAALPESQPEAQDDLAG